MTKQIVALILLALVWGSCGEKTKIKRSEKKVLFIQPLGNQESNLGNKIQSLQSDRSIVVDTSTSFTALNEDYLNSISTIILSGIEADKIPVKQQNLIQRYLESGGSLLLSACQAPSAFVWPWMQEIFSYSGEDTQGPPAPQDQFEFKNGRVARFDHFSEADDLNSVLNFLIGDNSYDLSKISTLALPDDERFTKITLDNQMNEPMEMVILPDLDVLYIERRGKMKLYDNYKKETRLINNFDVCTDGNYEDGLLGLELDPNYGKDNHFLYLYYSPPCDTTYQFLSRFTFEDDSLHLDSEIVMLKVLVQRETCCHSGGGLQFGPDGLLYLSTGDNTSSKESDGATPIDERPGRGPFDAQKSSGNTHDLRGKILRIRPLVDGTYEVPDGNLFPKDGSKGRPEIYTMGCRNPFRFDVDPKTGYLYWGDVGPDGGQTTKYGTQSFDEWNQAKKAGNFGWPYFVADNIAYPDRDFKTDQIGPPQKPEAPENHSPYNTGSKTLPPAEPAMIYYPYGESKDFPHLGGGGRSAMGGPVYYSDLHFKTSSTKLPDYYNGKLFIYEWVRNYINVVSFNEAGDMIKIEPFLRSVPFKGPIDMEFGPDGALYVLEYGNAYFLDNPEAQLARIEYAKGNRSPVPKVFADKTQGKAPLTVQFSAAESFDYDKEDQLTFEWLFEGKKVQATGEQTTHTFKENGIYQPILRVTDSNGKSEETNLTIEVGNEPPQLEVAMDGNRTFYSENPIAYNISISDNEDAEIDPLSSNVNFAYVSDDKFLKSLLDGTEKIPEGSLNFLEGKRQIELSDCRTCHQNEVMSTGPSYRAVAKKYKDRYDAVPYLAKKIIKGGKGNWGETMMSAHPQLSDEVVEAMVKYILALEDNTEMPLKGTLAYNQHQSSAPSGGYLLTASYKDKGSNGIGPITNKKVQILRSPKVEVELADATSGMTKYRFGSDKSQTLLSARNNSELTIKNIDLNGLSKLSFRLERLNGGTISVIKDTADGEIIGKLKVPSGGKESSGEKKDWEIVSIPLKNSSDFHDLIIRFEGTSEKHYWLFNLDWIKFHQSNQLSLK